jgi:hypothetical protein
LRPIDVFRAVRAAIASDADAIALSLNPAWSRSEWSMRAWPNLDVTDISSLIGGPPRWPWFVGLESPSDFAWRVLRDTSPLVESQTKANAQLTDWLDVLDVIRDPPEPLPAPVAPVDLPADSTEFWVERFFGPGALVDTKTRLQRLMEGIEISSGDAEMFIDLSFQAIADSGKPAYVYTTPLAADALADPQFDALAKQIELLWNRLGEPYESTTFVLAPRMITRDIPPYPFLDAIHPADSTPVVNVLAPLLCANWAAADPADTCTFNPAENP